jgi:hypothetical protein
VTLVEHIDHILAEGRLKAPPKLLKRLQAAVWRQVAAHIRANMDAGYVAVDDRALKKLPNAKKKRYAKFTVSKRDLSGWKFAPEDLPKLTFVIVVQQGQSLDDGAFAQGRFRDSWGHHQLEISAALPHRLITARDLEELDREVKRAVAHELIHWVQHSLPELIGVQGHDVLGLPASRPGEYHAPAKEGEKKPEQFARYLSTSIEFFAWLDTELDKFRTSNPTPKRVDVRRWVEQSKYFQALKKHQPRWYKKAVREFHREATSMSEDRLFEATEKGPKLSLTKTQAEMFEWALDAMVDYAMDPDSDYSRADLFKVQGRTVQFTMNKAVVEDLIYRLREQMTAMFDDLFPEQVGSRKRMQTAILKKMRVVADAVGAKWR